MFSLGFPLQETNKAEERESWYTLNRETEVTSIPAEPTGIPGAMTERYALS